MSGELARRRNENKGKRAYARSNNPRMRWSTHLHSCFISAVSKLGGENRATPKMILQVMGVEGISVSHVKSHLQMYRSMRQEILIKEAMEATKKNGRNMESVDEGIPQQIRCPTRPASRRQSRLEMMKEMYAKNGFDNNFPFNKNNVINFDIHQGCHKSSRPYSIVNHLQAGTSSTHQEVAKGKEKLSKNEVVETRCCSSSMITSAPDLTLKLGVSFSAPSIIDLSEDDVLLDLAL